MIPDISLDGIAKDGVDHCIPDRSRDLVLYPFDKRVLDIIDSDLDSVIRRVKKAYSEKGSSTNLQEYIVSYDKDIKIDAFIDQIRSSDLKLGQMSEIELS